MSSFLRHFLLFLFLILGCLSVVLGHEMMLRLTEISPGLLVIGRQVLIVLIGIGVTITLVTKFSKRLVWELVFLVAVILGMWYLFFVFFPWKIAVFLSLALILGEIFLRNVLWHNMFFVLGSLGLALTIAGWLGVEALVVLLVAFTVYDMLAAHPDGAIGVLAQHLVRSGIVPGFILPPTFVGLFQSLDRVAQKPIVNSERLQNQDSTGEEFDVDKEERRLYQNLGLVHMGLLGAIDVVLPLSLILRASMIDVRLGTYCVIGLMIGGIFLSQSSSHPRHVIAALNMGVVIPFVGMQLIGYFFT
ncbi:hypothetical protein IT408_03985 [Candidatus Uhrbacteria bacterium]|nr:hypothetical protein [Candidatus Uhrbacteria bacterium]